MFDRLLTVEQVSEQLQLSAKTIHGLCREGRLSYVQVTPRERRFLPEQVTEYIESRIVAKPKPAVDSKAPYRIPSPAKSIKGGKQQTGDSVRASLKKEMAEW
jgi:excisionase family DNA binding protein